MTLEQKLKGLREVAWTDLEEGHSLPNQGFGGINMLDMFGKQQGSHSDSKRINKGDISRNCAVVERKGSDNIGLCKLA